MLKSASQEKSNAKIKYKVVQKSLQASSSAVKLLAKSKQCFGMYRNLGKTCDFEMLFRGLYQKDGVT